VSREWADLRKAQWGETSAVYLNRVLGEFAAQDEAAIIPLAWVNAAIERWHEWDKKGRQTSVGVDVGGGLPTGDASTIAICYDWQRIFEIRQYPIAVDPSTATMELAGRVGGIIRHRGGTAYVDAVGIGAGVLHRMRELALSAEGFVAGRKTDYTDQSGELGFQNWRSAAWWITREMLDPESGFDVCLPPDDMMIGDLTAPKVKQVASASKIVVEAKEDVIKRLKRSTDVGDAVVQALVGPHLVRELSQTDEVVWATETIGEWF
jgi:hypothetical protein